MGKIMFCDKKNVKLLTLLLAMKAVEYFLVSFGGGGFYDINVAKLL